MGRGLTVLAIGLWVAACGPVPRPFQPTPEAAANPLAAPQESLEVRVEPVEGPPLPLGRLLAQSVAESLVELRVPAAARAAGTSRYVLKGRAEANRDNPEEPFIVLIDWTLVDGADDPVGLHTQGVDATWSQWEYGDPRMLRAVGRQAAKSIATLIQDQDQPPAPAAERRGLLVRPVQGAPGDGNQALTRAIRLAMKATAIATTEDPARAAYVLRGAVTVDPPYQGVQKVRVAWVVSTADGRDLGRITQENNLPAARLDGPWGRLAAEVAAAAVEAIERTLGTAARVR